MAELLEKQIAVYDSQDLDWRQIARERVFPNLASSLASMEIAHQNLLELSQAIFLKGQQHFKFDADLKFVIYVGIGCVAGWVTSYQGAPAILFGLENIAECGWSGRQAISGLIAHELGHVIHDQTRRDYLNNIGDDPWWQLYREGFAQYWEGLIMGAESWHQQMGEDPHWLEWCQENLAWLASEFLRRVKTGEAAQAFFGSWYDIQGTSQTGYYLGREVIKQLNKDKTIEEIALLEEIEFSLLGILEQIAAGSV